MLRRLTDRLRSARIPRPTFRGVGLLAAGIAALAVAYVSGRREFVYVSLVLLALPAIACAYVLVARMRLRVERVFGSGIVEVGQSTSVQVTVDNESALASTSVLWRDLLPGDAGSTPPGVLPALDGHLFADDRVGDRARVRYNLTPDRRGVFPIGPLVVDEQDPFRLCSMRHAVGEAQYLVVTPRVTPLEPISLSHALTDGASHQIHRQSSAGQDDLITREYQAGDPMRRVHWRATARHGELMVRQEEQRSNPEAMVLLDTDARHYRSDAGGVSDAFERAVECAASIALHLRMVGCGVQVLETARTTASYLGGGDPLVGGAGERDLLVRLAELEPRGDTDPEDFAAHAGGELRRSGHSVPLFAIVGGVEPGEAAHLATLRRWSEPAIAFVTGGVAGRMRNVLRPLENAGWICIDLDRVGGLSAAWAAVDGSEVGAHERV